MATVLGVVVGGGVFLGSWAYRGVERTSSAVWRSVGEALFVAWGIALLAVMLRPLPYPTDPGPDLAPFADVPAYLGAASWEVPALQLGGLALLFAAGGALLTARMRWGVLRPALAMAGVSVVVECLQHVLATGRHVASDDVLVAGVAGAVGAAVVVALRGRVGRVRARRTDRVVAAEALG
ncbi:VanZ family protein [Cellulomonas palmilytica]|nr:VanZ family protein [Cellulomonas palmilytica]